MIYLYLWAWPAIVGQCMIVCMQPLSWLPSFEEHEYDVQTDRATTGDRCM